MTERRTSEEFAHQMKALIDEFSPQAEGIRGVLDNLNVHTAAALYQTFPAEEARQIARKLEFRYTRKHVSWVNMV